jgi:hypothetical protein
VLKEGKITQLPYTNVNGTRESKETVWEQLKNFTFGRQTYEQPKKSSFYVIQDCV